MKNFFFPSHILLILLLNSSIHFAQTFSTVIVGDAQVNNQETIINEDNIINRKEKDTNKITGKLRFDNKVILSLGNEEYAVTANPNISWFMLFSTILFPEEKYGIYAQLIS